MPANALKELWSARAIVYYLIWKELRTSHRDKLLGNLWSLLDPLLMMMVLYAVFRYARGADAAFTLYLFTGLMAWDIFAKSLSGSSAVLKRYRYFIQKFPVPLSVFPTAIVFHKLNDMVWGLAAYLVIYLVVKVLALPSEAVPGPQVLLLPAWTLGYLVLTLGVSMTLARIGVFFGDVQDIVTILLRMGFFLNPVFLDMQLIPEHLHRTYFLLNPVAGYLIYFRMILPGGHQALRGFQIPVENYPLILAAWTVGIFALGFWSFTSQSRHYSKYL